MMQGFLMTITSQNKEFLLMGTRIKAPTEGIGTYHLVLDTSHHLDLLQTLYVSLVHMDLILFQNWIFLGSLLSLDMVIQSI